MSTKNEEYIGFPRLYGMENITQHSFSKFIFYKSGIKSTWNFYTLKLYLTNISGHIFFFFDSYRKQEVKTLYEKISFVLDNTFRDEASVILFPWNAHNSIIAFQMCLFATTNGNLKYSSCCSQVLILRRQLSHFFTYKEIPLEFLSELVVVCLHRF